MNLSSPFQGPAAGVQDIDLQGAPQQDLFSVLRQGAPQAGSDVPVLAHYLRMVVRRKWILGGAVAVALLLGLLITLLTTPLYTATTQIEIQRSADRIVKVEGVEQESTAGDLEFYQTQYGLLKSRSLAERVVRDLKLYDNRQFFETFKAVPEDAEAFTPARRDARIRSATSLLLANVSVSPVRGSRLVDISFTSPDPQLSERISNSWARHFIQANLERKFQSTAYARQFLEQRLEQLRRKLEESERLAVGYAGQQGIISVAAPSPNGAGENGEQRSLVADNLARLNAELSTATAERVKAQSRVQGGGRATYESLTNPTIAALRQRRADAGAEYAKLMVQFEPGYPAAVALRSQIERLDASIAREEGRVNEAIRGNYEDAVQRENAIAERVDRLKAEFVDQQRRSIQYNIYQREADTNRELYDGLLQRYKEIGVAGGVGANNVSIVDPAETPMMPSSPNLMINLLLALIVGLGVGVAIAVALEQIDEVISDPSEVATTLKAPLLGTVPKSDEDNPRDAVWDPKSPMTEAYLAIQTNLQFVTSHGAPRTLAVTSTRPAEGKSTTSYALALSLVRSRRSVLLIDGDMRSPSVHGFFGFKNTAGLSNYLSGNDELDSLIKTDAAPGLAVMSAGPLPPNAADLLSGERLSQLLDLLTQKFDHIIIDSPPVMGLADSPLISSRVEGTLYVVEAHKIRASLVRLALQRMASSKAHLLGIVLTKFEANKSHYGYGYDYGYTYEASRTKKDANLA